MVDKPTDHMGISQCLGSKAEYFDILDMGAVQYRFTPAQYKSV